MHDIAALQVFRQDAATVRVAAAQRRVVSWPGPGLTLAAPTKTVLEGRVQLAAQLGVLGAQPCQLDKHLPQQRLERRHVIGQRRVGGETGGIHAG
jgi:hypothetical protein